MDALSRAGAVTLDTGGKRPWKGQSEKILDTLRRYEFGHTDYRFVTPAPTLTARNLMRADLTKASSFLEDLAGAIQRRLHGACAVLVPELGFSEFDTNTRALLTYALSVCMGNPTATDRKRVIWDVQSRSIAESGYFTTFSETDQEAAFHTDTQYYPAPESAFLLYVVEAAGCGGGLSSICNARALRADIEEQEPWVAEVLKSRLFPFRVPTAFVTADDREAVQATLAPVFADSPLIRYRRDTLKEGFDKFPEYADVDSTRALAAFEDRLALGEHSASFFMPRDALVVMNNHEGLHARTAFQDPDRHLLRIRLQWEDAAKHTERYRIVTKTPQRLSV